MWVCRCDLDTNTSLPDEKQHERQTKVNLILVWQSSVVGKSHLEGAVCFWEDMDSVFKISRWNMMVLGGARINDCRVEKSVAERIVERSHLKFDRMTSIWQIMLGQCGKGGLWTKQKSVSFSFTENWQQHVVPLCLWCFVDAKLSWTPAITSTRSNTNSARTACSFMKKPIVPTIRTWIAVCVGAPSAD